jgi:hypothetical protein
MLNKLKQLLPEFEINRNGTLYDFKRPKQDGKILHIPAILNRADKPEGVARVIKEAWEELC